MTSVWLAHLFEDMRGRTKTARAYQRWREIVPRVRGKMPEREARSRKGNQDADNDM